MWCVTSFRSGVGEHALPARCVYKIPPWLHGSFVKQGDPKIDPQIP